LDSTEFNRNLGTTMKFSSRGDRTVKSFVLATSSAFLLSLMPIAATSQDFDFDGVADVLDNCSEKANPAQDDTDGDFCGNLCDADYNNNGVTGFPDFGEFTVAFSTSDEEKCHAEPIPGCTVGWVDFGYYAKSYSHAPGPSGTTTGTLACP
jgi:hypothetical protein